MGQNMNEFDKLEEKKDEGKQELYRETLHCFGKKAGGEIYQIIKDF